MSKFQVILLFIFGAFILVGVMIFSLSRGGGSQNATVTIWGSIPSAYWNAMANEVGLNDDNSLTMRYVEKAENTIESEFTEALATGTGPDLIILPLEKMWKHRAKLTLLPYESISARDFQAAFIEEGELYLTPDGLYALPLSVDPLMLYYNRDKLSQRGVSQPILYWDELYNASSVFTRKDGAGNITESLIALGEYRNIPNAKDILSMLILQAGAPITELSMEGFNMGNLVPALSGTFGLPASPTGSALDFYTQFANSARTYHSWTRALSDAQTHFVSGNSAYYLGFASELRVLKNKNPTLNLGVTQVPQSRVGDRVLTYGDMDGVSLVRGTRNPSASLRAALKLVSREVNLTLSDTLFLPPTRRDLLNTRPTDPILSTFYDAALLSRSWIDPDASATETLFRDMIESVVSGRARTTEALRSAEITLTSLIN